MKRIFISLAVVLMLVAVMAVPAMAAEGTKDASVTVNEVISVTIADAGNDGVNFGTLNQGDADKPDVAQSTADSTTPAVTVTMGAENNVNCDVSMKGTDFDATIPIGSAKWAEETYNAAKHDITTSFALVKSDVAPGGVVKIWHYITIPASATGGTSTSTFTYQAVKA